MAMNITDSNGKRWTVSYDQNGNETNRVPASGGNSQDDLSRQYGAGSDASYSQDKFYNQSKAKFISGAADSREINSAYGRNTVNSVSGLQQRQRNALYNLPDEPTHGFDIGTFLNLRAGEFYDQETGRIRLGTVGGKDGASYRGGVKTGTPESNKAYLDGNNTPAFRDLTDSERKKFETYTNGKAKVYTPGRGTASVGETINGQTVVDTNKLGINFDTGTGKMDKVNSRSGFDIKAVKYQTGTDPVTGKAIYAYAPTVSRKAYNMRLGGMIGNKRDNEDRIPEGKKIKHDNTVSYRDAAGNLVTEEKKPSYTKEGAAQRTAMKAYEQDRIKTANEVNEFQNSNKNLADWLEAGRSIEDWDKGQQKLADGQNRSYDAGDRNDAKYWADLDANSLNGTIAKSKRARDNAIAKVDESIEAEIRRKISGIGDVDDATRKALEDQIRASAQNNSKYIQQKEGINNKFDEWLSDNEANIGKKSRNEYLRVQKAAKVSKEKEQDEARTIAQEKKSRAELERLYPDLEITDEQVKAHAKATLSADPEELSSANKVMEMQKNGEIGKETEIIDSLSAFKGIDAAKKYWSKMLPAWEVTEQLNKYYTEIMGYTKEKADEKVKMSDRYDWLISKEDGAQLTEKKTEDLAEEMQNNTQAYNKLLARIETRNNIMREFGREPTPAEILNSDIAFEAKMNNERSLAAKEFATDKETNLEKLKISDRGQYAAKEYAYKKQLARSGAKTFEEFMDSFGSGTADANVFAIDAVTKEKTPDKYVVQFAYDNLPSNSETQPDNGGVDARTLVENQGYDYDAMIEDGKTDEEIIRDFS